MNRKIFALFALFAIFIGGSFVCSATTDMPFVKPDNVAVERGQSFTVICYTTNDSLFDEDTVFQESIRYMSSETPYNVYWTIKETVADDGLSVAIKVSVPNDADAGTYTMIVNDNPYYLVTIYVKGEKAFNWVQMAFFMLMGIIFIVFAGMLWNRAKRTKTIADDIALVFCGIAGVAFVGISLALYFGYLTL